MGNATSRSTGFLIVLGSLALFVATAAAELTKGETGAFTVVHKATVPVDPATAYDHLTGDISGWWDHSFETEPKRFFIEPRPGGGFYEYFDEDGENGVVHGTVIFARRGERLTFRGSLGFNGRALDLVVTYTLTAVDEGTRVKVECRGAGEMQEGWAAAVDGVWHHLLIERYVPYVEARADD